jgi:hypothetical protein
MMRSIAAVLGGFLVFSLSAVLLFNVSGRPPEVWPGATFATFAIIYGAVFAALAGYVAARLAPRAPLVHAAAVAGLLFGAATGSYLIQAPGASLWSLVSTILVSVPAAMFGGYLRHRSVPQRGAHQSAVRI